MKINVSQKHLLQVDFPRKFINNRLALSQHSTLIMFHQSLSNITPIYKSSTIILDTVQLPQQLYALSERTLPIRLLRVSQEGAQLISNIILKKKHSESFYCPTQLASAKDSLLGAGKKLLFRYDLHKMEMALQYDGKKGMASCLTARNEELLAAGFYDSNHISVFPFNSHEQCVRLEGHVDGVTQLAWLKDGQLISKARNDSCIYGWDIRRPDRYSFMLTLHDSICHQRLYFSLIESQRILAAGDSKGRLHLFDLKDGRHWEESIVENRVSCVQQIKDGVVVGFGQREFDFDQVKREKGLATISLTKMI